MKTIIIVLLIIISSSLFAANHTVGTGGDFTTLAQVNAHTFVAGDSILFKRGETFYGTLTISQNGTNGNNIIYGAWGPTNLAKPIITGFTSVTAWTNMGSNIWESTSTVSALTTLMMVTIGDINTAKGRTPNTGYYYYQSHSGTTQITSNNLTGTPNWSGAELAFCNTTFTIARVPITNQSGSTLTFTPDAVDNYIQTDNQRFIIQNDIRTLDVQNEWYFNPTTKKISIYSVSEPVNVKVSTVDYLVNQTNKSYITISNIDFTGSNSATFYLSKANYLTIQNCNMTYAGNWAVYGIYNAYSDYLTIENCNINQSNGGGIGISPDFRYATIRSNTVINTGMIFGAFEHPISTGNATAIYNGISAQGTNTLIENNNIQNTGYVGIRFKGNNTTVQNNFIDGAMKVLHDGGGIYTWNGNAVTSSNLKVLNNIILNCSDDCGLYFDDKTNHVTAVGNTISGCKYGVYCNNVYSNILRENTVYNNPSGALLLSNGQWASQLLTGNIINSNKFVAKGNTDIVMFCDYIEKILPGMSNDSNYYTRPIADNTIITSYQRTPTFLASYYTLAQWRTLSSQDANSNKSAYTLTSVADFLFDYNWGSGTKTVTFTGKRYHDVTGTAYTDEIVIPAYGSAVLIRDNTYVANPAILGSVSIDDAIGVTSSTLTGLLQVTNDGGGTITETGICYNTSINPTTSNSKIIKGTSVADYSFLITSLGKNTSYYIRGYVINEVGTAYSDNILTKTTAYSVLRNTGKMIKYNGKTIIY